MTTNTEANTRFPKTDLISVGLMFVVILLGVFAFPYAIPSTSQVVSASSLAGYNNSAAYILYLIFVVVTGAMLVRVLRSFPISMPTLTQEINFAPTRVVWAVLFGHLFLFVVLYVYKGYFAFGDGMYFQHILARMTAGSMAYRDINFLYGPAMLYPAFWLSSYLGVTAAYGTYYVATYLAGLYLLYLCVQAIIEKSQNANGVYLLFSLGLFNLLIGLNYVFDRQLLAFITIFVACTQR